MSDKPDKKPDAGAAGGEKADKKEGGKGGGLLSKTPVLLAGAMLIEAVVLIAGFKILTGGPKHADAAETAVEKDEHGNPKEGKKEGGEKDKEKKAVEIPVLDFRAINKVRGQTLLFDVSIFVVTKADHEEAVKAKIKERDALIKDRVRTIIAQSDPEKLGGGSEPGLETLRRQVKYQLDEIVGEGMIDEVLVPRCIPFRSDF